MGKMKIPGMYWNAICGLAVAALTGIMLYLQADGATLFIAPILLAVIPTIIKKIQTSQKPTESEAVSRSADATPNRSETDEFLWG